MQNYELMVILPGGISAAKKKTTQEKIGKIVEEQKGKVKEMGELGKIDLSRKIKKETSGIFLHFALELDGKAVKTVQDKLKTEGEIIRYLLVKKE